MLLGNALVRGAKRSVHVSLAPLGRAGDGSRFVLYCPPRTGSDLLVSLLDGHPRIRCEGEILHPVLPRPLTSFAGRAAVARLSGQPVWGCKIITQHLTWYEATYGPAAELLGHLAASGYQIVCLRRRDWLLQALSLIHAARTKYHFTVDDRARFEPMTLDPVEVLAYLHAVEVEDQAAAAAVREVPHLELWYEDDLLTAERQQVTLDRLTGLLGVDRIPARTRVAPGAPPSLAERVANLDEVVELVARTRFRRFTEPAAGALAMAGTAGGMAPMAGSAQI